MTTEASITALPELLAALPPALREAAAHTLQVEVAAGRLRIPLTLEPWAQAQFGALAALREQSVVTVLNRLTLEGAVFNPLRARRPAGASGGDAELERWLAEELRSDTFADPLAGTSEDLFGRIGGRWCVTAANIAKYSAWHGLVIPSEPHPLRFDAAQLTDYLAVALRWLARAHAHDPQALYPLITWNCLPKSGATIAHAHWQMLLGRALPTARQELWRRAAAGYRAARGRHYLGDLADIHAALGLELPLGRPRAFAHLTPARIREVVLIDADMPPPRDDSAEAEAAAAPLAEALARLLRALIDQIGVRAINVAIALPPLGPPQPGWADIAAVARVGDRGPALTTRSDVGAMELYGTPVIAVDPFTAAREIGAALAR